MCGQFTQNYSWEEVYNFLNLFGTPRNLHPRYNIAPTTNVDVVRLDVEGRREAIDTMLAGDVDTGKAILRDYIKATVGFEKLGEATDTPAKSPIHMFGPRGNPQARNLFGIIGYLQERAGIELHATPQRR